VIFFLFLNLLYQKEAPSADVGLIAMPQGNDFSPVVPDEIVTGTFDFGRWLPTGVTITSVVSVACEVYTGADGVASARLIGAPAIGPSPLTGAPGAAVLQQWGGMLAGVVYRLVAEINTSDNQRFVLYGHEPCVASR
jgi:hypothetical protein